jgi:hypothetical protein
LSAARPQSVIPVVDKVFATFGYPDVLKTDNGPPFQSHKWTQFMKTSGVKHRKITPAWPQANAQAESFNKPLMKAIRTAHIQHKNWRSELITFLRTYRSTPHTTTLFTPFKLMFDRDPKTKLPQLQNNTKHAVITQLQTCVTDLMQQDQQAKQKIKAYADKKNHAVHSYFLVIMFLQSNRKKTSCPHHSTHRPWLSPAQTVL